MIGRLVGTIVVLVLLAFFVGFNLDNKCSVNLLVHEFENVPVFFTITISFVAGIIFSLPFAFFNRSSKQKKKESVNATLSVKSPKKERKPFFKKKNTGERKNDASSANSAESPSAKPAEATGTAEAVAAQNEKSTKVVSSLETKGESGEKTISKTDAK